MSEGIGEGVSYIRLCSIVALLEGFENPISFISALLRCVGNVYVIVKSLIYKIGGKFMETLETKSNTGLLTDVMSTLLVVGNLGV